MARAPLASSLCIRSRSDSLCDDQNDHPASSVTRWAKDAKDVSQAKDAKCNGGARPPLLLLSRRRVAAAAAAAAALRHLHGEVVAALDVREERSLIKGRRCLDDRSFRPVRCGARNSRLLDGLKNGGLPPRGSTGDAASTG